MYVSRRSPSFPGTYPDQMRHPRFSGYVTLLVFGDQKTAEERCFWQHDFSIQNTASILEQISFCGIPIRIWVNFVGIQQSPNESSLDSTGSDDQNLTIIHED